MAFLMNAHAFDAKTVTVPFVSSRIICCKFPACSMQKSSIYVAPSHPHVSHAAREVEVQITPKDADPACGCPQSSSLSSYTGKVCRTLKSTVCV